MSAKRFASQIDLQRIPVLGLVPESSSTGSAPSSPVNGQLWFDTTLGRLFIREAGAWVLVSQTGVQLLSEKGQANGYASLDGASKVPYVQLPTGTTSNTVAAGDDPRLTDDRTPSGTAGGHLDGTYPNPFVRDGVLDADNFNANYVDGAPGTASLRTLGTGAQQAAAGNDSRFTDSRTPSGPAGGDLTGTYPSPEIATGVVDDTNVAAANKDGLTTTPSLRTLGTGAQQALAGNTRLDQITAPTAAVDMNGQRLTGLAEPFAGTDAATMNYVQVHVQQAQQGLDVKESVRAATTENITLSGLQTIDGVSLIAGDRVLVKNQTNPAQNGIYQADTLGWGRTSDADQAEKVTAGMFTFTEEGSTQADTGWVLTTDGPVTLDTTPLTFVQFSGAGTILAGQGLTKTGSTIDVGGTTDRITVSGDAVDIAPTYAGQTSITTLGTITTGTWNGTAIAIANGGTGATTAAGARANLGTTGKYAETLGSLTAGVEATITHNLNTTDVVASFRTTADGYDLLANWRVVDANSIGVTMDVAYSASEVRSVVVG